MATFTTDLLKGQQYLFDGDFAGSGASANNFYGSGATVVVTSGADITIYSPTGSSGGLGTASNGLTALGGDVKLGGMLTNPTNIELSGNTFIITETNSGGTNQILELSPSSNTVRLTNTCGAGLAVIGTLGSTDDVLLNTSLGAGFCASNSIGLFNADTVCMYTLSGASISADGRFDCVDLVTNNGACINIGGVDDCISLYTQNGAYMSIGSGINDCFSVTSGGAMLDVNGATDCIGIFTALGGGVEFNNNCAYISNNSAIVRLTGSTIGLTGGVDILTVPNSGTTSDLLLVRDSLGRVKTLSTSQVGGGSITGGTNGLSVSGADIALGGTLTSDTTITLADNAINFTNSRQIPDVGFNGTTNISVVQPDGKILVGGSFTTYDGVSKLRIVRLNTDGTIDNTFIVGTGVGGAVYDIALYTGGTILIAGSFQTYNGNSAKGLVKISSTGTYDSTFNTSIGFGFNQVQTIAIQSDNKILVGGSFTSYNGTPSNRIVRINSNASYDGTFAIGSGFGSTVRDIVIQGDGKIMVGGQFNFFNGNFAPYAIRLNDDGSVDSTFVNGVFSQSVFKIAIQADNKILFGGGFTNYSGVTAGGIIRLDSSGNTDFGFQSANGGFSSPGAYVSSIIIQPDNKLLVGGGFTSYIDGSGSTAVRYITRLNADGSINNSLTSGFLVSPNPNINNLSLQADGKILINGNYTSYNSTTVGRFTRINSNGTIDNTFNLKTVYDIINFDAGIVTTPNLVASGFTLNVASKGLNKVLTSNSSGVATWQIPAVSGATNGLTVSSNKVNLGGTLIQNTNLELSSKSLNLSNTFYPFVSTTGINGSVSSIKLQPDNKILVGGQFNSYNGVSKNNIVRLNSDSNIDTTFVTGVGFSQRVLTFALFTGGTILVGGDWFTTYDGVPCPASFAKLDVNGTIDASFGGSGADIYRRINTIAVQSDNKILIGGDLNVFNGSGAQKIARLNSDGTFDFSFTGSYNGFNDQVSAIAIQGDGRIIVGGNFTSYSGISVNRIVRLNSDSTLDTSFSGATGVGADANIWAISIQGDGKIVIVGNFGTYDGNASAGIARINPADGTIDPSFLVSPGFGFTYGGAQIYSISISASGNIWVGGYFDSYNGATISNDFAALDSNGNYLNYGNAGLDLFQGVNTIAIQADGKILIGGQFNTYNSTSLNNIARLTSTGAIDTSSPIINNFNFDTDILTIPNLVTSGFTFQDGSQQNGYVLTSDANGVGTWQIGGGGAGSASNGLSVSGDNIVLGGTLTGTTSIILNNNSVNFRNPYTVVGAGFNTTVNQFILQPDGKLLGIGQFSTYNDTSRIRIARVNTNGSVDTGFVVGSGFNGNPTAMALYSGGTIIVGGVFSTYDSNSSRRMVRIDSGGTYDSTFVVTGTGLDGQWTAPFSGIKAIAVQSDGKILVGGGFDDYNGTQIPQNLVRFNSDGSIDPTFTGLITGFNYDVYAIEIQLDGKILVGGWFDAYNGVYAGGLIRLNSDGSVDPTFSGITTGFGGFVVESLKLQPNGKILVGGNFNTYNGNPCGQYIIRLEPDGSVDAGFITGTGFDSQVKGFELQSDNKILVFGAMQQYDVTSFGKGLVRLNTDGSFDSTLNNGTGAVGIVNSSVVQPDGKIFAGGSFATYNGNTVGKIIRIDSGGTYDSTFNSQTLYTNIKLNNDVITSANFNLTGTTRNRCNTALGYNALCSNTTGCRNVAIGCGAGQNETGSQKLYIHNSNSVCPLIGGDFSARCVVTCGALKVGGTVSICLTPAAGSCATDALLVWNSSDKCVKQLPYPTIPTPTPPGLYYSCNGLVSDGTTVCLGSNPLVADTEIPLENSEFKLSNVYNGWNTGNGFHWSIDDNQTQLMGLAVQNDGKIIASGDFNCFDNNYVGCITRINTDGTIDNTFYTGIGFNQKVRSVGVQSDGKIIAAGNFTCFDGTYYAPRIARLNTDGSFDSTFSVGSGLDATVWTMAIHTGDTIILGGQFTTYSGVSANGIVRLNSGGTIDNTFNYGTGFNSNLLGISIDPNTNDIFVTGDFSAYKGVGTGFGLTKLNWYGTKDAGFNIGTGFGGVFGLKQVRYAGIQDDGKIVAVGWYDSFSGATANNIIRLNTNGSIDNTFNTGTGIPSTIGMRTYIQDSGKIIVVGAFNDYNGNYVGNIVRINTDGTIDTGFTTGSGAAAQINTIVPQSDGKLILGGWFTSFNGIQGYRIFRITANGAYDELLNSNFNYKKNILTASNGGFVSSGASGFGFDSYSGYKISGQTFLTSNTGTDSLIYGDFDTKMVKIDGCLCVTKLPAKSTETNIVYINVNGKLSSGATSTGGGGIGWSNLVNGSTVVGCGTPASASTICQNTYYGVSAGTKTTTGECNVAIGSCAFNKNLTGAGNVAVGYNAMSNNTGGTGNVGIGNCAGFYELGSDKLYISNTNTSRPLICGDFLNKTLTVNGCKLNINNEIYNFISGTGFDATVQTIAYDYNNDFIYVGGTFFNYNSQSAPFIAKLSQTGVLDTAFTLSGGSGFDSGVSSMEVSLVDGTIIVGGFFTSYNGFPTQYIAKLNPDGTLDTGFTTNLGGGFDNSVDAVAISYSDNTVVVGGQFTSYSGGSLGYIAKIGLDGILQTGFTFNSGSGFDFSVTSIVVNWVDDSILVGGQFTTYSGVTYNQIIRLNSDGTIDPTFSGITTGFNGMVTAVAIDTNDNSIVVGGYFSGYNGSQAPSIVRLTPDGSYDSTFSGITLGGFDSGIDALVIDPLDASVIVGGQFTQYNGFPSPYIAKLLSDGNRDTGFTTNIGYGFDNVVTSIIWDSSSANVIVGGQFTSFNTYVSNRIVKVKNTGLFDSTLIDTTFTADNKQNFLFGICNGQNRTGSANMAIGFNTLCCLTSGSLNTAIGYNSLRFNTSGSFNTALSSGALQSNISGCNNTAIGNNALLSNTIGKNNTAVGYWALTGNITGCTNTAIGYGALECTCGSGNIAVGYNAGKEVTGSNKLYIANAACTGSTSFIYGEFDNKRLKTNASLEVSSCCASGCCNFMYLGDKNTNDSWRMYVSGGTNLVFERRIGGNWTCKGSFVG